MNKKLNKIISKSVHFEGEGGGDKANLEKVKLWFFWDPFLIMCNRVYFMTGSTIYNRLGVAAP